MRSEIRAARTISQAWDKGGVMLSSWSTERTGFALSEALVEWGTGEQGKISTNALNALLLYHMLMTDFNTLPSAPGRVRPGKPVYQRRMCLP